MQFEYKVVPAPTRGKKAKGVKTPADRFALALSEVMNEMGSEGWEYLRADTLPAEERSGLTGRTTVFQNMLVFRRAVEAEADLGTDAESQDPLELSEIAKAHAPKLPSAQDAQAVPEKGAEAKIKTESDDAEDGKTGVAAE